jgi:diguanylate cyclase (GGDEF)-like protein/PAS domain S-box-containing protein
LKSINNNEINNIYKTIVESVIECIWLFDLKNMCFKYVSPSVMKLRGLTVEEAMNENLEEIFTGKSLEKILEIINEKKITNFLRGNRRKNNFYIIDEFRQYCKDGTIKNIEITIKFIFNEVTNYVDILGVSREINKRKTCNFNIRKEISNQSIFIKNLIESEQKCCKLANSLLEKNRILKKIAATDELTGIHNRYYFNKKIKELDGSKNYIDMTMIIFDIDNFKIINDTFGHDIGDDILKKVVCKILKLTRKSDLFVRWGGDEFVILASETNLHGGKILAEKLRGAVTEIQHLNICEITASFGVAQKRKMESFELWFKRVDIALYKSKNNGGNCVKTHQ